ncbi:hypothetical protein MKW92_003325 [Papaver armeniacum]|nr:hypothetical protein MKW92_003325 [Papaver armeniacum]
MDHRQNGTSEKDVSDSSQHHHTGTLRLFFHDCYVQGCDGSVLILPTDDNNSERNASINLSLAGDAFDIVDKAKAALEKECPGVVSCSDILAILARDAVHWVSYLHLLMLIKNVDSFYFATCQHWCGKDVKGFDCEFICCAQWEGPHWEVEKGRRDGLISNATEAQLLMPKSDENITTLIRGFESIGLSTADLVTLSGAHTIGFTHCIEFASRIFHNDTTLNSTIREKVILSCPFPKIDRNVAEALDQTSEFVFDNKFYKSLRQRKGLLLTDHVLAFGENDVSQKLVYRYSEDQELFFQEFAKAMVKLGRVGVKTGNEGEIRRDCKKFN